MSEGSQKMHALKFISGKYQGGEFPLRANREIVIGRSSDLDMVLVEDMVSRKHAKIVTSEENVVIQDLGSTNGTFVNGEKIKKARLKEGDRILIGTSILKLVLKAEGASAADEAAAKDALALAASQKRSDSTMSGRIEDVPVPDLLQLFQTSKRSGVLVIKGEQTGRSTCATGGSTTPSSATTTTSGPRRPSTAWSPGSRGSSSSPRPPMKSS